MIMPTGAMSDALRPSLTPITGAPTQWRPSAVHFAWMA
jgi:hypothetical protein